MAPLTTCAIMAYVERTNRAPTMTADQYQARIIDRTGGFGRWSSAQLRALGIPDRTMFEAVAAGFARIERVDVARLSTTYRLMFP